jgi:SAM-dependent methyltransferase
MLSYKVVQKEYGDEKIYGFHIDENFAVSLEAETQNDLYQKVVWGSQDDAINTEINADEKQVIDLANSIHPTGETLEVGCGSGRITEYICQTSSHTVALDQDREICRRVSERLSVSKLGSFEVKVSRFEDLPESKKFGKIFLLENLIGMNLSHQKRKKIFQKTSLLLQKNGLAVFAFRALESVPQGEMWYQGMPWQASNTEAQKKHEGLFGIAINWSVGAFLKELKLANCNLNLISIQAGNTRPAGGKSYFAVLRKS